MAENVNEMLSSLDDDDSYNHNNNNDDDDNYFLVKAGKKIARVTVEKLEETLDLLQKTLKLPRSKRLDKLMNSLKKTIKPEDDHRVHLPPTPRPSPPWFSMKDVFTEDFFVDNDNFFDNNVMRDDDDFNMVLIFPESRKQNDEEVTEEDAEDDVVEIKNTVSKVNNKERKKLWTFLKNYRLKELEKKMKTKENLQILN